MRENTSNERIFGRILVANAVSTLGSSVAAFSTMLWLNDHSARPEQLAWLTFCFMGPFIYSSIFIGPIVDRLPKKKVIIFCDLGSSLISLFILLLFQHPEGAVFVPLCAAYLFMGLLNGMQGLGILGLAKHFVREENLVRFNGLIGLSETAPGLFGPLMAAFFYEKTNVPILLAIDFASSVLMAMVCLATPIPGKAPSRAGLISHVQSGLGLIFHNTDLKSSLMVFASSNFFAGIASGLMTPFLLEAAGGELASVGANSALVSLGLAMGGAMVGKLPLRPTSPLKAIIILLALSAFIGRVLVTFAVGTLAIGTLLFLRNLLLPLANSLNDAIWQKSVSRELQGTVFGARRFIAQGVHPWGLLLAPVLIGLFQKQVGPFSARPVAKAMLWVGAIELGVIILLGTGKICASGARGRMH